MPQNEHSAGVYASLCFFWWRRLLEENRTYVGCFSSNCQAINVIKSFVQFHQLWPGFLDEIWPRISPIMFFFVTWALMRTTIYCVPLMLSDFVGNPLILVCLCARAHFRKWFLHVFFLVLCPMCLFHRFLPFMARLGAFAPFRLEAGAAPSSSAASRASWWSLGTETVADGFEVSSSVSVLLGLHRVAAERLGAQPWRRFKWRTCCVVWAPGPSDGNQRCRGAPVATCTCRLDLRRDKVPKLRSWTMTASPTPRIGEWKD